MRNSIYRCAPRPPPPLCLPVNIDVLLASVTGDRRRARRDGEYRLSVRDFAQKYVPPPPVAAVVVVVFWGLEIPVRWVSVDTTPPTGCRVTRARAHDLALGPGGRLGVGALFGVRAQVGVDDKLLIGVV